MTALLVMLVFFSAAMLAIGFRAVRRSRSYDDFLVAGRSHGVSAVTLSILATAVGASATVGLMDQAAAGGFPFFWFLGAAGVGLLVQGLTVAGRIRETGARTFSEVVLRQFGPKVHRVVTLLIVLGWTAIVAAQFKAAGSLVESLAGNRLGFQAGVILSAALIAGYTIPGGQHAVILTDTVQFGMIVAGLLGLLGIALAAAPEGTPAVSFVLLNDRFGPADWVHHLLIVGGIYVISPNLFSRSFAARDAGTARRATLWAAPVMVLLGVLIAYIGCRAAAGGLVPAGKSVFPALAALAGPPWNWLLGLSIFAAVVSSADTTLLVTASIAQQDLLRRESVAGVRAWVAGIAAGAVLLVLLTPGATLYALLFAAYNMFAPAVVPLVFAGFYAKRRMAPGWVWAALGVGMAAGLYGNAAGLLVLGGAEWETARAFAARTGRPVLTGGFLLASLLAGLGAWRARRA